MNLYYLAENLGMTVSTLKPQLSVQEYLGWLRFFTQRNEVDKPAEPVLESPEDFMKFFGSGV